ncbi:unnamed protein product, partial [marine sediment metagenome]
MARKLFSASEVKKITGASRHEAIRIPHYHAPPFLDALREWLLGSLSAGRGRPTLSGLKLVRKVRFSERSWDKLRAIAREWSDDEVSVSPAQIAGSILEQVISNVPHSG